MNTADRSTPMTAPTTSYHLRPGSGWLNDPNGMVLLNGVWHVFFQHNPTAPVHEQIVWGHATSQDLADWDLQPVAFSPSPGAPDAFGCWSGVFVPGHDRPAVAYSGIADDSLQSTICLRWGSPDLRDWGAPVVVGHTPEADGVAVMRDPFVLEHAGRRLAVLGAGMGDGTPAVLMFDRGNELSWRYNGVLVADDPVLRAVVGKADIWECPQLFPLGGRWVLIVSLQVSGVLGTVAAAVGDLVEKGGSWRFVVRSAQVVDGGSSLYAPQVVAAGSQHGIDQGGGGPVVVPGGQAPPLCDSGEPLLIGWVRQGHQDPEVRDHAGCLSLPRRLRLVDGVVTSRVDPGAARALAPGLPRCLPAGEVGLGERRWVVDVVGGAAAETVGEAAGKGTLLCHPELGTYELVPGDQVWVDGAVVELYRVSGLPFTWRHDEPWTLLVPSEGAAEVRDVVPRVP
ncbi:glycoside hydrolase family 32 protein [Actinomyces lilanjuaniae]|uniref:beta-fructofuranosidase n=2 Tax=Actinomyces lilanjuaniae TaxID=2321394 RepID=A0ABM6Z6D6_9ACTO|nr:glycoside hydrolase family 32 protein [Actinomyces lilanjuaniae]